MSNKKNFKFSIIMCAYKVENYIRESIESILKQDIGFEENMELILVNDGSPDNSDKICLEYQKKYPKNIKYIYKENGGLSDARNVGLKHVTGEIVNFCDPDDILEPDVCSKVYKFMDEHKEINLAAIRINLFEAATGFNHPLDYKFYETRVVDIFEEHESIHLSAATSFIRKDSIVNKMFNTKLKVSEDFPLVGEIILKDGKYGVIREAVYNYRKRYSQDSILGLSKRNESWYTDTPEYAYQKLIDLSISIYGKAIPYAQYAVMYDLQWRIKEPIDPNLNKDIKDKYVKKLKHLLSYIDYQIIFEMKKLDIDYKMIAAKLKNPKFEEELEFNEKGLLHKKEDFYVMFRKLIKAQINVLEVNESNELEMTGWLYTRQLDGIEFKICDTDGNEYKMNIEEYGHRHLVDNFGIATNIKAFTAKIKIEPKRKIFIKYKYRNQEGIAKIQTGSYSRVSEKIKNSYFTTKKWNIKLIKDKICMYNKSFKSVLKSEVKYTINLLKLKKIKLVVYRMLYFIAKIFKKKEIWIVSDRFNAANDNGIILYKYLLENEKDAKVYFVLSKKYDEYKKFKGMKNLLAYETIKYKILFLLSDKVISSQADEPYLNPFGKNKHYIKNLYNYKFVFLQHGITKNDISGWLNKHEKNIKLFITAAKPEYDSLFEYNYYYDKKDVKLTGLARYDALENRNKKKILIMPTWRKNLAGEVNPKVSIRKYNESFKYSDYFQFYNGLLENKKLLECLKKHKYECHFYVHPSIIAQAKDFKGNKYVKVHDEIADYNKEFCEGSLLVTDYSSVAFDFAYLEKPVIYSQYDKETFYEGHLYDEGYFDYERDGFGPVITDKEKLVDEIVRYIKKECKMEKKYIDRTKTFYEFNDKNNCKRIHQEIKKIK